MISTVLIPCISKLLRIQKDIPPHLPLKPPTIKAILLDGSNKQTNPAIYSSKLAPKSVIFN